MLDYPIIKNNFMPKDTFLIRLLYKIGAILDMFPSNLQSANICTQFIGVTVLNSLGIALLVKFRLEDFYAKEYNVLLDCTILTIYMLFNLFTLHGFVAYRKKWRFFFRIISSIDRNMGNTYVSKFIIGTKIIAILLLYAAILYSKIPLWTSNSLIKILTTIYWCYITTQIFIVTGFISETATLLTSRHKIFQEELKRFCHGMYIRKSDLIYKMKLIKDVWRNFYFITDHVNMVFGKHLFMLLTLNFIEFLHSVNDILTLVKTEGVESIQKSSYKFSYVFVLSIFTMIIIIAGDRIEKGGIKLIKCCYCLMVDIDDEFIKEHMKELSQLVNELRPILSICSYVEINRQFLPVIISSTTAYLIILIQLNL